MNISIYNYNKRENTFLYEKTTSHNLSTLNNQIKHLATNRPLKIVEYVIRKHKEKKKCVKEAATTTKFKLTTLNNLARKRQKMKQMLHYNHHNNNNKQQQNRYNNVNNGNKHFQHQHQFMQPIPQPTMTSYQSYFGSTNMNMNQQQQNLFQFNSNPNSFQSNANTFRQRASFNTKSLKSKSIKIGRATTLTNTMSSSSNNNQFKFQPSSSTTSMPVSNLSSSNEAFTNIMSASFGVNPGVAQAAAAACATLAQLLRSELTINLANDQPRLVISGSRPQTQQQQQQNNLNCNNNNKRKLFTNNSNSKNSNKDQFNSNLKSKSHRFKHFKSGNLNTNLASTPATAITSLPQTIVVKNKTAPYNTTQYIMHDYTKRRSLKDQVCPSDDFSQDWNKALEAAAHEATCSSSSGGGGIADDASASSSAVVDSTTHFNFNFLNFKSSKLVESGGLVDILDFRDKSGSQQQPSSTTNDESNLAEIGRKLSRSFSNLCPIVTPSSSSSSTNIECIEMRDENDDDDLVEDSTASAAATALFSSSI